MSEMVKKQRCQCTSDVAVSNTSSTHIRVVRQHCRLTICIELVELTNSETAAATPSGAGAKSLRSLSSLETGSYWRFLVNYSSYIYISTQLGCWEGLFIAFHQISHWQDWLKSAETTLIGLSQFLKSVAKLWLVCHKCQSLGEKCSTYQSFVTDLSYCDRPVGVVSTDLY